MKIFNLLYASLISVGLSSNINNAPSVSANVTFFGYSIRIDVDRQYNQYYISNIPLQVLTYYQDVLGLVHNFHDNTFQAPYSLRNNLTTTWELTGHVDVIYSRAFINFMNIDMVWTYSASLYNKDTGEYLTNNVQDWWNDTNYLYDSFIFTNKISFVSPDLYFDPTFEFTNATAGYIGGYPIAQMSLDNVNHFTLDPSFEQSYDLGKTLFDFCTFLVDALEGLGNQQLYDRGFQAGYSQGFYDGSTQGQISEIFAAVVDVGLLPINAFLMMFNFEILGINMSSFVSALLSVAIVIIIIKTVTGKGGGGE